MKDVIFESRRLQAVLAMAVLLAFSTPLGAAPATIIRVGPDGSWDTVQDALDLVTDPATNYVIRIRAGSVFNENLVVDMSSGGYLDISGGWDSSFSVRADGFEVGTTSPWSDTAG